MRVDSRRQVAIAGHVTLAPSGEPAAGALVVLASAPAAYAAWLARWAAQYGGRLAGVAARPDQVRAAADGLYGFLDLPAGHYALAATVPGGGSRYAAGAGTADVAVGPGGDVALARADISIPATTLAGRVTRGVGGPPVHLAAVRIAASGESAFTAADGTFALAGVEAGARTLLVSAGGARPASIPVTLSAGARTTVDVPLADAA